jgi:uncharacterized membrane protein YfcA
MQVFNLSPLNYALVLPFIFLAGLIDSIAGGGGLISLPAYWSVGIPPHLALGTNKFSSCCGTVFSTANYFKAKMIDLPVALLSAFMALIGSWIGASTALKVSAQVLNYLLIILIPAVAVFSVLNRNIGMQSNAHRIAKKTRMLVGAIAGLSIGFYDGFFGPGTGTFLILIYASALHYDFVTANGNTKVVNLASNIAALVTFAFASNIYYPLAVPGAICGIAGNIVGSKLVILRGNKLIRSVFILALVLLFIRVIYNII